jgi:ABC-type glycerol-3-phosphate transport system permease component
MTAKTLPVGLRIAYTFRKAFLYIALTFGAFLAIFPFIWMVLTSFKNYAEATASPPQFIPTMWAQRVNVVAKMVTSQPLFFMGLLLWVVLGVVIAWRLYKGWWGAIYVVAHLAVGIVVWNLGLLGRALTWNALWAEALKTLGYDLTPFWDNYVKAWEIAPFGRYFINSAIMSTVTPLLIICTAAPAAYAFARMRFPGKDVIFVLFLATMMIPEEVILIPNYVTISKLKWIDTYQALILPWIVNVVTIFFLRQFFKSIPDDLYDAAVLDGSSHLHFLRTIALPLSAPALVSTALFNFLGAWNSVQWPLYVTNSQMMRPLMVGMKYFSDEMGMQMHLQNAAATFTTLPVIILFLFVQKQFIEGIAHTGLK